MKQRLRVCDNVEERRYAKTSGRLEEKKEGEREEGPGGSADQLVILLNEAQDC